jgi:hypothetical protein
MGQQEVLVLLRALRIPGLCLIFSGSIFSQCFARPHVIDPVFDQIKSHTLVIDTDKFIATKIADRQD